MDDLVEQVVVQVGGGRKTQKLHREGGDEAQRDSGRTQDNKHQQKVGVGLRVRETQLSESAFKNHILQKAHGVKLYLSLLSAAGGERGVGQTLIGLGGRPEGQPVVDGNDDGVFEELGRHHEEDHEETTGGHVAPAHLRRQEQPLAF